MTCEEMQGRMELPFEEHAPAELSEMWRHILCCERCKEAFGWQFQLSWLLQDVMEEPPAGFSGRVMAACTAQSAALVRLPWWKRRKTLAAVAAALAVVLLSPAALHAVRQSVTKDALPELWMQSDEAAPETGSVSSSFSLAAPEFSQNDTLTDGEQDAAADQVQSGDAIDGAGNSLSRGAAANGQDSGETAAAAGYGEGDMCGPIAENDLAGAQSPMKMYVSAVTQSTLVDWRELLPTQLVSDPSQVTVVIYSALPPEQYAEHVEFDPMDCYVVEVAGGYALYLVRD